MNWWVRLLRRERAERELDAELRDHIERVIAENLRKGMNKSEARRAARLAFGSLEQAKEECREARATLWLANALQDLRYALRTLRRSPGYTATCIAVLALAIGTNTAMFSVLDAVLFRPLPYASPQRLAMLWTEHPHQNRREGRSDYWNVEQWQQQSRGFADMAVSDGVSMTLARAGGAEQIQAERASLNFFSLLGVQPFRGASSLKRRPSSGSASL